MPNSESVGKKIVEALKKQAENIEVPEDVNFDVNTETADVQEREDMFASSNDDIFAEPERPVKKQKNSFFDDDEEESSDSFFTDSASPSTQSVETSSESFEMPANIAVLKKLISQLPSGVSRHTGAQIIKQTMEALGISMKSVLQDAQQVQEGLKVSARECQTSIQEYKKQILALEKQSQSYQKQYSALNDLISLFIQTTR